MPSPSPSSSSSPSRPSARRIRFKDKDEVMEDLECDAVDDVPSTPPRPIDPRMLHDLPSPTDSSSSASSSEGPMTPSPIARRFVNLKSPHTSFESQHDAVSLHSYLSVNASFVWDMALPPPHFDDDSRPAAEWVSDGEPLADLTLTLDGIYEWNIDVASSGSNLYPTISDVFEVIHRNMSKLVGRDAVNHLHPHTRKRVYAAREARCSELGLSSAEEPLRRVDFLIGARRFLGVSASPGTQRLVLNVGILPSRN